MNTRVVRVDPDDPALERSAAIVEAAALLRAGRLVAFPTETVYGLGADATDEAAVAAIFAAKGRPYSDPLITHIPSRAALFTVAASAPPLALALAERFWPGPLTLILPRGERIPPLVAAGGPTVGVRAPRHPVAQALLAAAGIPIAAPSANRFMRVSPTTAAHALADLDGRIDCVLDGGPTTVGIESTVLDVTVDPPRVLRPGGVSLEALRAVAPAIRGPLARVAQAAPAADAAEGGQRAGESNGERDGERDEVARAPGQMERHYAPGARLIVFDGQGAGALAALRRVALAALARGERVGALLPDGEAAELAALGVRVAALGPGNDLDGVARRLYAALRELDAHAPDLLLAHTFAPTGAGLALNDRLRRAAGGALTPVTSGEDS